MSHSSSNATTTYAAVSGSPSAQNDSLREQHVPFGAHVKLRCSHCNSSVDWPFVTYSADGSVSVDGKEINIETRRKVLAHMRGFHRGEAPPIKARGPRKATATTASVITAPVAAVAAVVVTGPTPSQSHRPGDATSAQLHPGEAAQHHPAALQLQPSASRLGVMVEVISGVKVQLPCFIEQRFVHPLYGLQHIVAELLWSDVSLPEPIRSGTRELYHTDKDNVAYMCKETGTTEYLFPICAKWLTPTRMCFFHQIVKVDPPSSPLAIYYNEMFSSFLASTQQLQSNGGSFSDWRLIDQNAWTMERVITECGFRNMHLSKPTNSIRTCELFVSTGEQEAMKLYMQRNLLRIATPVPKRRLAAPTSNSLINLTQGMAVAPSWTWLTYDANDPRQRLDTVPNEQRKSAAASWTRQCHAQVLQDVTLRDALALLCRLECIESTCTQTTMPSAGNRPDDGDVNVANKFRCCHEVVHDPFYAVDPTMYKLKESENGPIDRSGGFDMFVVPRVIARDSLVDKDDLKASAVPEGKRPRKRQPPTKWENRIKFELLDPTRLNHSLEAAIKKAINLYLNISRGCNIRNPDRAPDDADFEKQAQRIRIFDEFRQRQQMIMNLKQMADFTPYWKWNKNICEEVWTIQGPDGQPQPYQPEMTDEELCLINAAPVPHNARILVRMHKSVRQALE